MAPKWFNHWTTWAGLHGAETDHVVADECSPSFTYCDVLVRYERSQLEAPPSTSNWFTRRLMRKSWFMVSKTAEMSRPTNMVASLLPAAAYTLFITHLHDSASVVRATIIVNGERQTLTPPPLNPLTIFTNICTGDYVGDIYRPAKFYLDRIMGFVSTHARLRAPMFTRLFFEGGF